MKLKQYCVLAALFLAAPALTAGSALLSDDVFTDASYEDAARQAQRDGRVLVIDFTAVWCGPCKMMDKNTWSDDSVIDWMNEHGVAVKVDVDKQKSIAQKYNVRAMPTVVVVKDGEEFDRVVGYRGPDALLTWLNGVLDGTTSVDQARQAAGERPKPGEQADMQARMQLARTLVQQGKLAEATDEYVWLWKNIEAHDPGMSGVRVSFMASDMEKLANEHEPAKRAFAGLRDELTPTVESGKADYDVLIDWVTLSEVIDDDQAVVDWFDDVRDDPAMHGQLQMIDLRLFRMLVERDRLADLLVLYPDPVADAQARIERTEQMLRSMKNRFEGDQLTTVTEGLTSTRNNSVARLYAACLAADRDDGASAVAKRLLRADDSSHVVFELVSKALDAREARGEQEQWLLDLPSGSERDRLLRRVRQQLAQQTTSG